MKCALRRLLVLLATLGLAAPARAQVTPVTERVPVLVTSVVGRSVYLDGGRAAGIEPGDPLHLYPTGLPLVSATIVSVATHSARAELSGVLTLPIGTRGEVLVPAQRLAAPPGSDEAEPPADGSGFDGSEAREWSHPPETWDSALPLLAPTGARRPEERAWRATGRLWSDFDGTRDSGDIDTGYLTNRAGLDLMVENPFRAGGVLELVGYAYHRTANLEDANDESESRWLVQRLSYRHEDRGARRRYELGRFLHEDFPELGVLDGLDYALGRASGNRIGASIGYLPDPSDEFKTGHDLATSLTFHHASDSSERFVAGAALQKTWHDGEPDRDLLVLRTRLLPSARSRIQASALVDYYGSGDELKDHGLELTQLFLDGGLDWKAWGVQAFTSIYRHPELLRAELAGVPDEDIAQKRVLRSGTDLWVRPLEPLRLSARVDGWSDGDTSGHGWRLGAVLRDTLWKDGELGASLYSNEGEFTSGSGLRVWASRWTQHGTLRIGYDLGVSESATSIGGNDTLLEHGVLASYDARLGRGWTLSCYVEDRSRDDQNSLAVGLGISRGF